VKAPRIQECYAHLECKLNQNIPLGDHTLFIGKVVAVQADTNAFTNDILQIDTVQPLYYIGGNRYTAINKHKEKVF